VQVSGVGGLTPLDVNRVRGSRIATVTPYINSQTQGVTGTTSKRDLELALQLTYLYFTSPNVDRTSFERVKAALAPAVSAQAENPASVFNLRRQRLNASNHPRFKETTQADVAALDMDRLLQTYRERFANAANFTFVFAGPFTEADITPLLVQYVAALPSTGARDARVVEDHLEFPAAITREVFAKGHEPRAQTALSFFADTRLDEVESLRVRIAAIIVESQLRLALREQLGATYTVDVAYTDVSPTPGFGTVSVQYVSAPANSERLTASVLSEITRLVTAGPASDAFGSAKEAYKRQLTANEARSMYWAQSLLTLHMLGRDPRVMLERVSHVDALTAADVQAAIRKYFDVNRYTLLVMNPEP
jgi:zinc protease